jgi:hypothetical protein
MNKCGAVLYLLKIRFKKTDIPADIVYNIYHGGELFVLFWCVCWCSVCVVYCVDCCCVGLINVCCV